MDRRRLLDILTKILIIVQLTNSLSASEAFSAEGTPSPQISFRHRRFLPRALHRAIHVRK